MSPGTKTQWEAKLARELRWSRPQRSSPWGMEQVRKGSETYIFYVLSHITLAHHFVLAIPMSTHRSNGSRTQQSLIPQESSAFIGWDTCVRLACVSTLQPAQTVHARKLVAVRATLGQSGLEARMNKYIFSMSWANHSENGMTQFCRAFLARLSPSFP